MTVAENVRINAQVPFPSNVVGAGYIRVAKVGGIWTISFAYTDPFNIQSTNDAASATDITASIHTYGGVAIEKSLKVGTSVNIGTTLNTGGKVTTTVTGLSGILAHVISATQTQPNAGDTADGAASFNWAIAANSATNELVARLFTYSATNGLTGGGHVQNLRLLDLFASSNAGTFTDTVAHIFIEAGVKLGTVTSSIGLCIADLYGTFKYGILDSVPGSVWSHQGTTPSTLPSNGALVVAGGVGIGGALNVAGAVACSFTLDVVNVISTTGGNAAFQLYDRANGGAHAWAIYSTSNIFRILSNGAAADLVTLNEAGLFTLAGGSLSRGSPVTKTADFTVAATENNLINNKAAATCTVTLPSAATFPGREILIQNYQAFTVVSASANVVQLGGASTTTAILAAVVGRWAKLVSNGTNWVIMAAN